MGFNTTLLILNDHCHEIENDPEFGKKVVQAIMEFSGYKKEPHIRIGGHLNSAKVIESHHADDVVIVAVGGNTGRVLGRCSWKSTDEELIKELASTAGYRLVRKNDRSNRNRKAQTRADASRKRKRSKS